MLHYILQVSAFQLVFLLIYDLFLKRETFFNYNRVYLLLTTLVAFLLPFVKLDSLQSVTSKDFVIVLPEIIIGIPAIATSPDQQLYSTVSIAIEENTMPVWQTVILLGVLISALYFAFKLIKLYWLKYKNPRRWQGNILLVNLLKSNAAFSFFNTIFLGERIPESQKTTILRHELVHVKQWHSLDLLCFEIIRVFMWFNPLIYMYQNRLKALHEYIADEIAVKQNGKKTYYQELLNQVFETNNMSFTNTFFKSSLIKKRIVMLQKSESKQIALLKYVLLIPVVCGMLFYVSCGKKSYSNDLASGANLEQYSYQLSSKDGVVAPEIMKMKKAYEAFLVANKDYVGWGEYSSDMKVVNYSVHPKNEKLPAGYSEGTITTADGDSYMIYYNKSPFEVYETEEEKPIKEEVKEFISRVYASKSEVPYAVIENVPTFPECADLKTNDERKKCTSNSVAKFVNMNFNTDLADSLGLLGRQRISVGFKISKDGNVESVYARAPHPELEKEAQRVISMLPKFIPGTQKGKPVTVPYAIPIIFEVQDNSNTNIKAEIKKSSYNDNGAESGLAFSKVDKAPFLKACTDYKSNEERKKCTSQNIAKFVNKNFNTDLAAKLGLEGRQRISVGFKIGINGQVHSVVSRAPHPKLEDEAKRVINMLPDFIPGEKDGKKVDVTYGLPIVFQVFSDSKKKD